MAENIILIGFMGSGKTSIGMRLAEMLGWPFYDSDQLAEERIGMPIIEYFRLEGEARFRELEEDITLELLSHKPDDQPGQVLSLGGGAVTVEAIFKELKSEPLVILLDAEPDEAYEHAQGQERPLAADRDSFIALYNERRDLYQEASRIKISTEGKNVDQIAIEIANIIQSRN